MSVTDIETLGTSPGASPVMVAIAAADTHVRPLAVPLRPADAADAKQQGGAVSPSAAAEVAPEPKALSWAERNSWFGSDTEMTQLAYQVHDGLVEQGIDPASDAYYDAIEQQVAAAFPDKWAQHLAILTALGAKSTAAAGQLLASNAASYYNGTGPLTGGAKQGWSTGKYGQGMEAGKCLAEVLRSGACPGNKSLAELQADYRAARALVLDQLQRQKEDAEAQRKRILMQIGRAINSSNWRA
ncbi:hypothetical protein OEZ86_005341 [Tetradesmus obliquus]|nr:hypothetical protein OEZ86_005341 [Tetradesmus obliquus]